MPTALQQGRRLALYFCFPSILFRQFAVSSKGSPPSLESSAFSVGKNAC